MGHLLGYVRVSTVDQDPALQLDALLKAGCARTFTDQASGAVTMRPELNRLLEVLLPGDTLVVWKLDRLGRSLTHLLATVTALAERGVGFRSLTEGIDTTTAAGRVRFPSWVLLAEFERVLILKRALAGMAAARSRGSRPWAADGNDSGQDRHRLDPGRGRRPRTGVTPSRISRSPCRVAA